MLVLVPALGGAVASLGGGCGSSTNSGAPATAAAACMQIHAAYAARAVRCGGGTVVDWLAYINSFEDCAAYTKHVADGDVQYRPQGWAACLDEYEKPCDSIVSFCAYDILHGLVPDGAPCKDTEVCAPDSVCIDMALSSSTCGTVCMRAAKLGEACGLWCGGTTPCVSLPFCEPGAACDATSTCVTAKPAGAACGPSDPLVCGPFLACSADPNDPQSTGICQPQSTNGSCHLDADCTSDHFCLQGTCAPRRPLGSPCADAPNGCAPFSACDSTRNVCVTAGRLGQPCAPYPGIQYYSVCFVGSCFDGVTCTPLVGTGASCAAASCAPGNSCDANTTTCTACPP